MGALPALGASLLLPSVLAEPHMLPDGSPSDITLEEAKGYGWTSLEERRRTMIPFEPIWVGTGMPTPGEVDFVRSQQFQMPAEVSNDAVKKYPFPELTPDDHMSWAEWDELHFEIAQCAAKGDFHERVKWLVAKFRRLHTLGKGDMQHAPEPTMEDVSRQYVLRLFVGSAMTWQIVNELATELYMLCKKQKAEKGFFFIKHPHDKQQYFELRDTIIGMREDLLRYKPDSSERELVIYVAAATALLAALYAYNGHLAPPLQKSRGRGGGVRGRKAAAAAKGAAREGGGQGRAKSGGGGKKRR